MDNVPESPRPTPNSTIGRLLLINGPLLGLVILLWLAASKAEGYLSGLEEIIAIFGLVGLGALVNLVQAAATKGSRVGYLVMAALYGAAFYCFCYIFANVGKLNPGG